MKGKASLALVAALVMVVAVLALVGVRPATVEASNPDPQQLTKVYSWATYTFLPAAAITTTGTYSTGCPYYRAGTNVCIANGFAQADVFVTADVSGTGWVTITPQVSADALSWADLTYEATAWLSGTATLTRPTYQIVASADGTQYMRIPLYGEYLRFKYATSVMSTTLGDTIPSLQIKVTYKNFQ